LALSLPLAILLPLTFAQAAQAQELTEARRIEVARRLQSSSVSISVGNAGGSGFVAGSERWVVTNGHVVQPARAGRVLVRFGDGSERTGTVLYVDPIHDLAILEIENGAPAEPLPIGDSDAVQVGQTVLAFGSPFGLDGTLTQGIVSARRDIPGRSGQDDIRGVIQTDAPINPGNSGGPLVNSQGEVIGVNTAILSRSGGSHGIGFAMPSSYVQRVLERVRAGAREPRVANPSTPAVDSPVWLGVECEAVETPRFSGVRVRRVIPGGPAARAGIRGLSDPAPNDVRVHGVPWTGHIILAVDGQPVGDMESLHRVLSAHRPGDRAVLTLTVGPNGSLTGQANVRLVAPPEQR
jgi:S1-C subfamily serine protease